MYQYQILSPEVVNTPLRTAELRGAYPFDVDNAYPQRVMWLATKVPQAAHGLGLLNQFCLGQGLDGAGVEEIVNAGRQQVFYDKRNDLVRYLPLTRPDTLAQFFAKACVSLSMNNGVYVHVGFDKSGMPISYSVMNFENMRIAAPDDPKHAGKIIWWNNWAGEMKGNRRDLKEPVYYSPYTGDNSAAKAEMQAMGDTFPGQVYYIMYGPAWDSGMYPISSMHSILGVADTAWQLNIYTNSLVRKGFHHGQTLIVPFEMGDAKDALLQNLAQQEGANKAGGTLVVDGMREGTTLVPRQATNHADQFRSVEEDLTKKIRMAFGIPITLYDAVPGQLGNTSALKDAFEIYNQTTKQRRSFLAAEMRYLFSGSGIPGIQAQDFEVEPLAFEGTTITTPQPTTPPAQ